MDAFTALWLVWLLMFLGIEGAALFRKERGDTLSEHVWKWFSVKDKAPGWIARRVALLAFLLWLFLHLGWGML